MDLPTPDATANHQTGSGLSPVFLKCTLRMLAAALPAAGVTPEIAAENFEAARELFFAMQPRDQVAAASAVRAVVAHFASMDMHARASQPGLSDDAVRHLRAAANTCSRACDAAKRSLRKPAATPARSDTSREFVPHPDSLTARRFEPEEVFQARDRFGQPIPRWRTNLMTKNQLFATIAYPRDPELEAAAIAEEEAMIAEQKALDAANGEAAASSE
jgi:hypothetical protein